MNLKEIIARLQSGEMKVDTRGHNSTFTKKGASAKYIIESVEDRLEHLKGVITKCRLDGEFDMAERFEGRINDNVPFGSYIESIEVYCFDCGDNLYVIPMNENLLTVCGSSDYWKILKASKEQYGFTFKEVTEIPQCGFDKRDNKESIVTEIEVPSGQMVFANYFNKKEIYESPKYSSINSIMGRVDLANYLATKNVGYGQMGNMSVTIFLKDDGSEIIVGDNYRYVYDEETDTEDEIYYEFEGFTQIASISLGVWRWMCADHQILTEHEETELADFEPTEPTEDYSDTVMVEVKKGTWVIEHFYDIQGEREDGIYSRLSIK